MCTLDLTDDVLRGAVVVQARGEVDLCSAPALEHHLSAVLTGQPHAIVVDLAAVTFLDCAGLRVLVAARRRAASRGLRLALAAPHAAVARLLRITALDRHFDVFPTVAAAVALMDIDPDPMPRLAPGYSGASRPDPRRSARRTAPPAGERARR